MVTENEIREAIKRADVQVEIDSFSANESFQDIGLDSLDRFNIFLEVENLLGHQVPDDDIEKLQTIRSIQEYVNEKKNAI